MCSLKKFSLLVSLVFCSITCFCQSEKAAVIATLDKFRTAIQTEKYFQAVGYADSATISFYDSLLLIVQNADSATLASTPLMKKLMALNFRHRDSAADIKNFDGKQLLAFAMKKNMVSYNNMIGDSIVNIQIGDGSAKVMTYYKSINGGDPLVVHLIKDQEKWKISFVTELPYAEKLIRRMMQESGGDENEFLFSLLENITGTRPAQKIWHPN